MSTSRIPVLYSSVSLLAREGKKCAPARLGRTQMPNQVARRRLTCRRPLYPREIEIINPVRRSPGYSPTFNMLIPPSKDAALTFANLTNTTVPVRVYSDGSGYEGGIGAAALLYINDRLVRSLRFYLGTSLEHTVYEAEGVGILMGVHLLHGLSRQLTHSTVLGSDSQAAIRALGNQRAHSEIGRASCRERVSPRV